MSNTRCSANASNLVTIPPNIPSVELAFYEVLGLLHEFSVLMNRLLTSFSYLNILALWSF